MNYRHLGVLALSLSMLVLGAPQDAAAQCKEFCILCGVPGVRSGYGGNAQWDGWSYGCAQGDCQLCGPELVSENTPTAEAVISQLESASSDDLAEVVALHGSRLLLNQARNMVVIQGGCDGNVPVSLVFLPREKVEVLKRLGVRTLEEFVATIEES